MGTRTEAVPRAEEQALIAEARAQARRRRIRRALVIGAAAITVTGGTVAGLAVSGTPHAGPAPARAVVPAAHTGVVTGHLSVCMGIYVPHRLTPGTVTVLRGKITWQKAGQDGPYSTWREILPATPAVAVERITDNYRQTFSFVLPPGHYVLVGGYDAGGLRPATDAEVTVVEGRTAHVNLPNRCK
jgi:hypothetical protein